MDETPFATIDLPAIFARPPDAYRPVPFWWWVGEPLRRERLLWQLDQLKSRGVRGAVISYNHLPDGRNNPGEPPVFSAAWWELLREMLGECRRRGLVLAFQDYTLIGPILAGIGRDFPAMIGGELCERHARVRAGERAELDCPAGSRVLVAMAHPRAGDPVVLTGHVRGGRLCWTPAAGEWLVSLVVVRPGPIDAMHPEAGRKLIERLYAPFERHCSGELGQTLAVFFQDELDFGIRMPMWSDRLPAAFAEAKGYDLVERLPGLWHDLGPATPKLRVDYADLVVRSLEKAYFVPVYEWHERRGLLLGNDNCGRGAIGTGRAFYGDYFRTMRWYSAPGTDDPQLQRPRAFQGLKVNSSIAHLYRRPRVWVECFHSSGWGATPAQILAALNEDFLLGANFVNLHGLYYTTFGSWWEWAPPDFHFRQPYWIQAGPLNDYIARLSAILSRGVHVCDVAILYPITAIEGGLNAGRSAGEALGASLSEQQRGEPEAPVDPAEACAFRMGRELIEAGGDFDFLDFESLDRAEIVGAALEVAGESYRVLVLPMMSCIRFSNLGKIRDFCRAGGTVVALGCLPIASDRVGAEDPEVDAIVREIFDDDRGWQPRRQRGILIEADIGEAVRVVRGAGAPDFVSDAGLQALHRRSGGREIYFVRNPCKRPVAAEAVFRASGAVEQWDPWTGEIIALAASETTPAATRIALELAAHEAKLIVFDPSRTASGRLGPAAVAIEPVMTLPEIGWNCELFPTMDNRFGDFRLPPSAGALGAEARTFRHREEGPGCENWPRADFEDSGWASVTASYGPRFWCLGPVPPAEAAARAGDVEETLRKLTAVDPKRPVVIAGRSYFWRPYEFSQEWGIEHDPFLGTWASGPHGLKGRVPDEFIDLHCEEPGSTWYLWSSLPSADGAEAALVAASRSAFAVWLNGEPALGRARALPAGRHPVWHLPFYESEPERRTVRLARGDNPVLMRLEQAPGQRVRAYVAIDAPPVRDRPALRWFAGGGGRFNARPGERVHAGWYRFLSPPGLRSLTVSARGELTAWVDGCPARVLSSSRTAGGWPEYVVTPAAGVDNGSRPGPVTVALRVQQEGDSFGGDSLPMPVRMECGLGVIALGDWSAQGLGGYSGAVWYRRTFELNPRDLRGALLLDLGEVRAAATVHLNGIGLGAAMAPPWRVDITAAVEPGVNRLEVLVANTLANHYGGLPTAYVFEGQTVSGLLGPVRIWRRFGGK